MPNLTKFLKKPSVWISVSALFVCSLSLLLWHCTEVSDTCGDGKSLNPHAQFCFQNRTYEKCEGKEYNPEEQGCVNGLLLKRCGSYFYDENIEFCSQANRIYDKCDGKNFDPSTTTDCNGTTIGARCDSGIPSSDISFCYNGKEYPKCGGEKYNVDSLFCNEPILVPLCGGKKYDRIEQECVGDSIINIAKGYTLKVTVEPHDGVGEVTRSPNASSYGVGALVDVTATPKDGWWFDKWSGADTSSSNPVEIHMIGDLVLTANFKTYGSLADSRDGQSYKTVLIGTQTWMAENLNYRTADSWCYGEDGEVMVLTDYNIPSLITLSSSEIQSNCNTYGRLYTWDAAMGACPVGWHLPTRQEWDVLVITAGSSENLRSQSWGNGKNTLWFSALPGGSRRTDGRFLELGWYGDWWTATWLDASHAYSWYAGESDGNRDKDYGFSVRCVQDD
jgi:uncharacterized protein (TIGR02145 family)